MHAPRPVSTAQMSLPASHIVLELRHLVGCSSVASSLIDQATASPFDLSADPIVTSSLVPWALSILMLPLQWNAGASWLNLHDSQPRLIEHAQSVRSGLVSLSC